MSNFTRTPLALITGASGGIGSACAAALMDSGFRLALHAHTDLGKAEALRTRLKAGEAQVRCFQANLAEAGAGQKLVDDVATQFGPPTLLVHCAGVLLEKPIAFTTSDEIDQMLHVHSVSAFSISRGMRPHIQTAKFGRLIFIGSLAGIAGLGNGVGYAASKGALSGLAQTWALECASWNATANVVAPGYVETTMTSRHDDERIAKTIKRIPLGRYAKAHEVASLVAWLCSAGAAYMTGQVLTMDGGLGLI